MSRVALAVGGAALVLVGGAVLTWDGAGSAERSTEVSGIQRVRVDGGAGDVRIRYEPGGAGGVEQVVRSWALFGDGEPNHRVENGTLVLDADCGWWCSVDYDVVLPRAVPVEGHRESGSVSVAGMRSLRVEVGSGRIDASDIETSVNARTSSGAVAVRGARGPVDVQSGSGRIELDSISGELRARTGSGQIEGESIAARQIYARTSSGGLRLELTGPRDANLSTGSGQIDVTVPQDRYRVDSRTGSGAVEVEVGQDPAADKQLELATGSGDIQVNAAS